MASDFTDERLAKIEGLAKAYQATEAGWQLDDHLDAVNDFRDATRPDTVLSMCQRIREQAKDNAHLARLLMANATTSIQRLARIDEQAKEIERLREALHEEDAWKERASQAISDRDMRVADERAEGPEEGT